MKRVKPGPGQESVWGYPRPPAVEDSKKAIRVEFNGTIVAETTDAKRVLETSHPPVYYIPPEDVKKEYLKPSFLATVCEFKGTAQYHTLEVKKKRSENACWSYPDPKPGYESIKDYLAFYPGRVDACFVDGERVKPQPGDFYGGWITGDIAGPFKGGPGTGFW